MMTVVKVVEALMYLLGALGVGTGLWGICSILLAFRRGDDQLLAQRREEAEQRRHGGTSLGA